MRCSRRAFLAALGAGAVAAIGTGTSAAGESPASGGDRGTTWLTATDVHVPGYPTVEAIRWMGAQLLERTSGRLGIRLYHSGQLGRESDAIDLARYGALDITRVHMGSLNNPFPATRILSAPYVFRSTEHLRRSLDGEPGKRILAHFADRGLVGLTFYDSGARNFYNTRHPVRTPADLHGLKIRVPPSDLFMQMVRAFGANPVPLPYGEVFSGLQTHLIDGAENNWMTFHTTRQFEEARHYSLTGHSYAPEALLLSRRRDESLEPSDRELIRELAVASVPLMREAWDRTEADTRSKVVAAGVEVSEADRDAFARAAAPVVDRLVASDDEQRELHRLVTELA
ncbi:MAG TPA: TRAP transporter substrate-binding protein [Xanthomonadales bacterium]|nr:TRAP transporter substrate-binding protein [Xanthomonadales bacterium]